MRTDFQQFFVFPDNVQSDSFYLEGDEFRHAVKVLRKQTGDALTAIDGCGHLYSGVIQEIEKNRVVISIKDTQHNVGEPDLKLTIAHAVPKGNIFDLVVEKGTEIGVSIFQPIITKRSNGHPDSRIERWQNKVIAATKQCGRSCCPSVEKPVLFDDYLNQNEFDIAFIAHEAIEPSEQNALKELDTFSRITVFVGPEGGFTESELESAASAGVIPINLGIRRLRSETAAIVAATKIMTLAGELG